MKRYQLIFLVLLFAGFLSCGDDSELSSKILINQPDMSWGASMEEIKNKMNGFDLVESDAKNLYYAGNGMEHALSYYFIDGALETSLVTVSADAIAQETLEGFLKSYTFLGEKNNMKVYCKESTKTLAVISNTQISGKKYYYIGYSRIN